MKPFKSLLFRRIIQPGSIDYWDYLHAEALFRLKQVELLNCPCHHCLKDKTHYRWLIDKLENEGKISMYKRPTNFTRIGKCGRDENGLPPVA